MTDLNTPSFFRKNGLLTPLAHREQRTEAGKNPDGSFYIDIGPGQARSILTPVQTFELAKGLLRALGITVEFEFRQ